MNNKSSLALKFKKLDVGVRYFDQLVSDDLRLPANKRYGVAMMLGLRRWEFAKILRVKRK